MNASTPPAVAPAMREAIGFSFSFPFGDIIEVLAVVDGEEMPQLVLMSPSTRCRYADSLTAETHGRDQISPPPPLMTTTVQ